VSHFPRFLVFSSYYASYNVHYSFIVCGHFPGHTVFVSHFPRFSVFSPRSRSYSVFLSYLNFSLFLAIFQVLQCVSQFASFSVFLAIFQVLPSEFLIFLVCQFFFFRHIQCPAMCVSHFPCWSVFLPYSMSYKVNFQFSLFVSFLAIFHVLQCGFLIFTFFFQCFWPFSRSYSVCVSFSTFVSFLATIQVLNGVYFLFHVFTVFCHIPGPTVGVSHFALFQCFLPYFMSYHVTFSFSSSVSFLAIIQVLRCAFLRLHVFQFFSLYSRSYSVCVSFSTFFTVSRHISVPTVCVSHFSRFLV